MTGILSHFGFGKSAEEREAQEREKNKKALAKVKKDIKELYKNNINENTEEMVRLEKVVEDAEKAVGEGNFEEARAKLNEAAGLVKDAKNELKDQKRYREDMKALRAEVTRLGYLLRTGFNVSLVKQMHEALDKAGESAAKAEYAEARKIMEAVKRGVEDLNRQVPKSREEFIKELDRANAALKQLEVIGLKDDADYQEIQKMIQAAEHTAANDMDWAKARDLLKGHAAIMKKKSVVDKRKETEAKLASGEFMEGASEDDWADAVIDLFNLSPRLEKGDMHDMDVQIGIKPQDYEKYKRLQEKIAAKGLEEYQRPTINLTVKGKGQEVPVSSFGIIGGTGPLSDAEMLEKTMKNLESQEGYDPDKVHIRLLSAPPPRDSEEGVNLTKWVDYGARLVNFCKEPHSKMALASNTAHMNIDWARGARTVGGGGRKEEAGPGPTHQVQDLSASVVEEIMNDPDPDGRELKPLIMGTKTAYDDGDNGMYGKKFAAAGVTTATNVAPKDSIKLQAWIDEAKRGHTTPELTAALKQFIKEEIKRQPETTHIVLGCTELPLALGGHDGIAAFQEELREEGINVKLFDTEALFAEQYTKMANENSGVEPPPREHGAPSGSGEKEEASEAIEEEEPPRLELDAVGRDTCLQLIMESLEKRLADLPSSGKEKVDDDELKRVAMIIRDAATAGTVLPSGLGDGLGLNDEVLADIAKQVQIALAAAT